ncbi:MAG TPA: tetratricopeptide repeat protein [Dehalococcoidia bacterium]|nr:tetratricopeptide repeat protein [Dehalococcoidia bacterium]
MSTILLYLSLGMVVLWTARSAWAKGRNPWVWGGVTVALALVLWMLDFGLWQLAAMSPMVVLLFLRSRAPQGQAKPPSEGATCPKCQTRHLSSQHYCVNCGWDLSKPSQAPAATGEAAAPPQPAVAEAKPAVVASQVLKEPVVAAAPAASPPPAPEPQPQPKPLRVHRLPTAAGMTEQGLALFGQGKIQEAIDQFTKAIALDPSYLTAWQRRAEAYQRLGRPKEAAEDMRRLQALGGQAKQGA